MTGNRSCRQAIPVVTGPTKFMNHRRQSQTRVGGSAGDYDLSTLIQSLDHGPGAQVDIRALNAFAHFCQRLAGIHVAQLNTSVQHFIDAAHDVITGNKSYAELPAKSEF